MADLSQVGTRRNGQGLESLRQALEQSRRNGNGHGHIFQQPRKVFLRELPRRIGTLEGQVERLDNQVQKLVDGVTVLEAMVEVATIEQERRVAAIEIQPDVGLTMRVNNLVEIVARLAGQQRRIDKRTLRSRRKLAVIADQVELQFE